LSIPYTHRLWEKPEFVTPKPFPIGGLSQDSSYRKKSREKLNYSTPVPHFLCDGRLLMLEALETGRVTLWHRAKQENVNPLALHG
jgi:hypothetical protein